MIEKIVIHCSATPPNLDVGVDEIRQWHKSSPRYWSDIGYHYVIRRNGFIEKGRHENVQGAHVYGHNKNSIGVCLVGGVVSAKGKSDSNFTFEQYQSLNELHYDLKTRHPQATTCGHRDLDNKKDCPCFI